MTFEIREDFLLFFWGGKNTEGWLVRGLRTGNSGERGPFLRLPVYAIIILGGPGVVFCFLQSNGVFWREHSRFRRNVSWQHSALESV